MAQNIPRNIVDPKKMQAALAAVSAQLAQRLQQDHSFRGEIGDLSQPLLHLRNQVDPTDHGEYFPWIVRRYLRGDIRLWEDMGRVGAALRQLHFGKATRQLAGECSDINRLNSLSELEDLVEPLVPASQKDLSREERARIDAETEEVYRDANLRIIIPRTEAASIFWGKGTRWCTAASTSENHFESYNDEGPLHILLINDRAKGQEVKLQLHFELNEFLNSRDEPLSPDECRLLIEALRASQATDFIRRLETEMSSLLLKYGWPQTPELCLAAVQQKAFALEHVREQTPEISLASVQKNAHVLQFVQEQTPEICLAAVQQNGLALRYVRENTSELCLVAVQQNGGALQFVREQTPEICLAAVQQSAFALHFVHEGYRAHCRDYLDGSLSEEQALDLMRGPVEPALEKSL